MVDNFAGLFNCTPVDRASDSMKAMTLSYSFSWLFQILLGFGNIQQQMFFFSPDSLKTYILVYSTALNETRHEENK